MTVSMPAPGFPAARARPGTARTAPGLQSAPCAIPRSASGRPAGVTRPAPAPGTASFYPARRGRDKAFDELRAYAEHFDTVEVNSTFYRIPRPEATRSWVERTPSGFEFSVKLFQKLTHPRMFLDCRRNRPGAPKGMVAEKSTLPHDQALAAAGVSTADVDEFRRAIDPLASAGKLGAILVQFPSFKHDAAGVDHLAWLTKALRDYRVAVELRHKSWSDESRRRCRC